MQHKIDQDVNQDHARERRIFLFFSLMLFSAAWIYIWLRAVLVPFQSDEVATFFMYVQSGMFLPPTATVDANNHILNSLLTWISFRIFGSGPVALRLPVIFAALVYFYYLFRLSQEIRWAFARWGFLILCTGTHFLIEFFGYSRGYGLSMAFLAGALYHLIMLTGRARLRHVILATLYILLATAANLNLIIISLSVYMSLLFFLIDKRKSFDRRSFPGGLAFVLLAGGISSYYFIDFSLAIRKVAGFYYGAADGFFPVTVRSLASMVSGDFHVLTEILILSAFYIAVLLTFYSLFRNKFRLPEPHPWSIFFILILISWISSILMNLILKVNFQEDRAAMHLIPLFYGLVFFGIDRLYPFLKKYTVILLIPFLIFPAFSIAQISLERSVYGNSQQVPAEFFSYIKNEYARKEFPPVVSSYQARRQAWAYMNYRAGGKLNPLKTSSFPDRSADFLIHEFPLPDSLAGYFEPILKDQVTQAALFRTKNTPDYQVYKTLKIETPLNADHLYNQLVMINSDSLAGNSLRLEIDLQIESGTRPLHATIVAEVFDEARKSMAYEAIDLDQLQTVWDSESHDFHHVILIQNMPADSKSILVYLWNKNKAPVVIMQGRTDIKFCTAPK